MDGKPPPYEEPLGLTRRQARQGDESRAAVERLKAELEPSRRAGKRQAAPFSKGPPNAHPKRPGRPAGHPPSHRPLPPPGQGDRTLEVPLPEVGPGCHAPLDDAPVTVHDRYQIDLPEPNPTITRVRVPVARCPACYRRARGRHPEQTSGGLGAAAVPDGPRWLGLAADLKHRLGASYRKCPSVLLTLTGLVVASAALARRSRRLRRSARPRYDRLAEAARPGAVQHVDEAGRKVGGRSAWLGGFADEHAALYRIGKSRGQEVVIEVLGDDSVGVLVSGCPLAYDPLSVRKRKGSAHPLKRCSEVERSKRRGAVRLSRRVAAWSRRAMALKRRRGALSDRGDAVLRGKVHAERDRLLAGTYTDPEHARRAELLGEHRDSVPRLLGHDGVGATNHLAEREGRPAVIARERLAGGRTGEGAEAHAVPAGVPRTDRRRGRDILGAVVALVRHGPGHLLEFDHIATPAPALGEAGHSIQVMHTELPTPTR